MVETLDDAIVKIQAKLKDQEIKGSIGDLVRLLQLRQELGRYATAAGDGAMGG